MTLGVYLSYKKQARDAIKFYEQVFQTTCTDLMAYGDMPPSPEVPEMDAETKQLVMNASLEISGNKVMFSDVPDFMEFTQGSNITLVIDTTNEEELTAQFNAISEGGTIVMPLEKTFWSEKYGQVTDKFGIGWQFNLSA
ncbi:VOC family protein [Carnobacterium gallinarum]|uniref:VOC family protein n=1 Tax=Carnobacterium gallinarum TaxID=2749 RepID=UPI0005525C6E|nr:VOC family protein [Carnobacterium gallinarum]